MVTEDTSTAELILNFYASLGEVLRFQNVEELKNKVIARPGVLSVMTLSTSVIQ